MTKVTNIYVICAFAAIGGGLFGFDISSMSGVLGTNAYKNYFGHPVGYQQGGITAAMPAGSLVGALSSSYMGDILSRKVAIQIAAVIWIIGSIIQAASQNIGMLVVGRIIAGVCVGITSALVPVYQSEIAPKEIRGRVVSLQQWAITWGILIQYFIQYGCSFMGGGPEDPNQTPNAFRIPWGVQAIPGLILAVGLIWFPRSPRWLASKDRWEEALTVLADIHGKGDKNAPKVLAEFQDIQESIRFEREQAVNSYKALVAPKMLKRLSLGMGIQMWSQLCGMNVMMYYIVYVMQGAGVDDPLLTASIQYIINVVMTVPCLLYMDKIGRRPILLAGSFFMMTWLFITGSIQGAFGQPNNEPNAEVTWILVDRASQSKVVVACSYLFVATFATTWGPVSWTYPAEIYPLQIRAKAVSLSTATNWIWNCILAFAVPPLLRSINWKMYMIFATFNACALIHMFFMAYETKGKTLEEMDEVFDGPYKPWQKAPVGSRLDALAKDIEEGKVKVAHIHETTESKAA